MPVQTYEEIMFRGVYHTRLMATATTRKDPERKGTVCRLFWCDHAGTKYAGGRKKKVYATDGDVKRGYKTSCGCRHGGPRSARNIPTPVEIICGERSEGGLECHLPPGHPGYHEANDDEHGEVCSWNTFTETAEPPVENTCGDKHGDLECYLTPGHVGYHTAYDEKDKVCTWISITKTAETVENTCGGTHPKGYRCQLFEGHDGSHYENAREDGIHWWTLTEKTPKKTAPEEEDVMSSLLTVMDNLLTQAKELNDRRAEHELEVERCETLLAKNARNLQRVRLALDVNPYEDKTLATRLKIVGAAELTQEELTRNAEEVLETRSKEAT